MANIPTLSSGAWFEARLTRSIRNFSRACREHARGLVACPARLFVVAGVLFVAAALYDARDLLANALLPAVDRDLLMASVTGAMLALVAAVLWLRALRLDAAIRQLAAALEDHGLEELPRSLVERGTPSIARLAAAINDAHHQHADRVTELLHVLAAYAHDLRTPLTRVMLRSGMLEDRALRDAMERDLAEMGELINASLACARLQCSVAEPPRSVDVDALLGSLVDNYRDAGLAVALDGRLDCPLVTFPHALRRVLVNLIDNALRYGRDVRLCVRVRCPARDACGGGFRAGHRAGGDGSGLHAVVPGAADSGACAGIRIGACDRTAADASDAGRAAAEQSQHRRPRSARDVAACCRMTAGRRCRRRGVPVLPRLPFSDPCVRPMRSAALA